MVSAIIVLMHASIWYKQIVHIGVQLLRNSLQHQTCILGTPKARLSRVLSRGLYPRHGVRLVQDEQLEGRARVARHRLANYGRHMQSPLLS